MRSIKQQKKLSKRAPVIIGVVLALILAGTAIAYTQNLGPFQNESSTEPQDGESYINLDEPTEDQVRAGEETAEQTSEPDPSSSDTTNSNSQPTTVTVEFSSGPSVNSGTLSVRAIVQELNTSGSCTLTLSKSGSTTITKTAGAQAFANVSTCKGFDFSVKNLDKGTWDIAIQYKSSGSVGKTTGKVRI